MIQRYLLFLFCGMMPIIAGAQSIEFVRNDGQWDAPFRYKARAGDGEIFLSANEFTYLLSSPVNKGQMDKAHHGWSKEPVVLRFHAYRMSFVGARQDVEMTSAKEQSWYYNYILGNDEKRWKGGIHPALAVDYKNIYDGIDMHVASEQGQMKYEWMVSKGQDPAVIRMKIEGDDGLRIREGNLVITTSIGDVQELKPVAYQYDDQGRTEVVCQYRLEGKELFYHFPKGWNKDLPLVIDPTVVFCSMTGSTADNWGYTATYDPNGNFYAGGIMLSYFGSGGGSFPSTVGAFQTTFAGGVNDPRPDTSDAHGVGFASDIAIMKLNSTGTTRIWATYIGGSDNEQPHSIIVDGNGNLVIAGVTYSSNYPVTSGAYDVTANGKADIIVTTLNPTGSALVGSTYVGGTEADGVNYHGSEYVFGNLKHNYGDNARSEVIVDRNNNVYVTASTKSTNFPVTSNAYQSNSAGAQDAVVMKLNPSLTTLTYSTYLGGSADDAGYVLALDTAQTHLYVAGGTQSSNFPSTGTVWKGTYQGGSADGYIARFGNGGSYPFQKSSFVGTGSYDQVYGVQVDLENGVYVMGQTLGGTFPVTAGVYRNTGSSQFVMKMDSMLTTNVFSTVFGSGNSAKTNISPVAFLVDTCQNIYISGWGGNLGFTFGTDSVGNTVGMPVTTATIPAGSVLKSTTDGSDFYFIALAKNASSLLFAAYHGRNSSDSLQGEHVDGGTSRFDRTGVIYQAICGGCAGRTTSGAYPTSAGSWATSNGSSNCNEVALKIAFQLGAPDAVAAASPKTKGCPPLTVQFANTSTNAISYQWNFRDGSPIDTAFQPKHIFTVPGTYNVQLIVYNPNACKMRDTTLVTIIVDSNRVKSGFNVVVTDSCNPYRASFTNTSSYSSLPGAAARTTFTWYFGDGTSFSGNTPAAHDFPGTGTYTVMLVMRDTAACNSPDTLKKVITINSSRVTAGFSSPDSVCLRGGLLFTNLSTNATGITWYFGDGQTSSSTTSVTQVYKTAGSFTVMIVAANPKTCNKTDTLRKTILIKKLPIADFIHTPTIPEANKPVQFTNRSVNADLYSWNFGDGSVRSTEVSPSHLFRKTGTFAVCLIATSTEGCADTICRKVDADIHTALDLPTGFSPNGDGNNDVLFVRGGGIENMTLKIFNRWGEKVFESNALSHGWDGTYKGKPQEMDAYAFVLTATFIDGSSATKKGNITLLR